MLGLGKFLNKQDLIKTPLIISEMESLVEWDEYYNCTASVDTVNYISGIGSLELIRTTESILTLSSTYDYAVDLTKYKNLNYYFYIADKTDLDSINLILFTSAEKTLSSSFIDSVNSSDITIGWNEIVTTLSEYTQTGIATLEEVKAIRLETIMSEV